MFSIYRARTSLVRVFLTANNLAYLRDNRGSTVYGITIAGCAFKTLVCTSVGI